MLNCDRIPGLTGVFCTASTEATQIWYFLQQQVYERTYQAVMKDFSLNPFPPLSYKITSLPTSDDCVITISMKSLTASSLCQSTFTRALEQRALNWDPSEPSWFVDYLAPWSGAVCWGWSCWSCLCSCPVTLSVFMETLPQVKPLSVIGLGFVFFLANIVVFFC